MTTKNVNSLAIPSLMLVFASLAHAQAPRTWVSGVGDDANPCSRTAPCKTWAGAISKTAANGEIDALDPGGFGAVTITKGITLDGGGGQVASTLVAGTNGIVVAAGASDAVTIRNLRLDGLVTQGSLNGIKFTSGGTLHVENAYIFGFKTGIETDSTAGALSVVNTTITESSVSGMLLSNNGTASADIQDTFIFNTPIGVQVTDGLRAVLRNCEISQTSQFGVQVLVTSRSAVATLVGNTFHSDPIAIQGSIGAHVIVSGNVFSDDGTVFNQNGGSIFTNGDNPSFNNTTVGTTSGTLPKI